MPTAIRAAPFRRELGAFGAGIAMKLAANRGLCDSGDTKGLLRACGVSSVAQAQAICEADHAQGVLSPSAQARVRALLGQEDQQAAAGDWRLATPVSDGRGFGSGDLAAGGHAAPTAPGWSDSEKGQTHARPGAGQGLRRSPVRSTTISRILRTSAEESLFQATSRGTYPGGSSG